MLWSKTNDYSGMFNTFLSFFKTKPELESKLKGIPYIVNKFYEDENNYYLIQKNIYEMFDNRYHDEYINLMTLGFYAFMETIKEVDFKKMYAANYLKHLVQINIIGEKHPLYDCPSDQDVMIDFTSPIL